MLRIGWIASVVVVVSSLGSVRADACSLRLLQVAQPPDGATNVPLNVVPRIVGISDGIADMPLRLTGPAGDVALTVVRHDANSLEVRPRCCWRRRRRTSSPTSPPIPTRRPSTPSR